MAKFLNTSATNYFLEELIKNARDRLVLISPFLKLNDRIKELLEDKKSQEIYSRNAKSVLYKDFTWNKIVHEYDHLYSSLLDEVKSPHSA